MVSRFAGASLGLLAFAITAIAGLLVHNPVMVVLSRSILALVVFCGIGLVLGAAAQIVINEHERSREEEILKRFREEPNEADEVKVVEPVEEVSGTESTPSAA